MLLLKGCPRCHGDLMLVTYMDERSTNCLQCGFTRALPVADEGKQTVSPALLREEHRATSLRARLAWPVGA